MLENTLQRKIQKYLKDNLPKSVVWKNHGNQYSVIGLPDLMCIQNGKLICIEVKIEGNRTTELQDITLRKLNTAGAYTIVAFSVKDVENFLIRNHFIDGGTDDENK